MFSRLSGTVVAHRRLIVVVGLIAVVAAAVFGGGVASRLTNGGLDDPKSESAIAERLLEEEFGAAEPNLIFLVDAGDVDDPDVMSAGLELTAALAEEDGVTGVVSYWSLGGAAPLRSEDGTQALLLGRVPVDDQLADRMEVLSEKYTKDGVLDIEVGGSAEVFRQMQATIEADLATAEKIAFPITLVLLALVFGAVVSAGLPLVVGGFAIVGTFLVLNVLTGFTEVSIFALNLTTALGLGLGIDYSLFVVSRYREELAVDGDAHAAARRTVTTAGRTVAFSGITVAISLAALLVFPLGFLRSFAYAGIAVVIIAALVAVIFLPAVLAMLGSRVDKIRIIRHRTRSEGNTGFWHRMATFVMRRPGRIAASVTLLLALLALPFLGIELGLSDDRVLPADSSVRAVQDEIREGFGSREASALPVIAADIGALDTQTEAIGNYAAELSTVQGVARVDALTGSYVDGQLVLGATPLSERFRGDDATYLSVVPAIEPISPEGEALVLAIRDVEAPFDVLVGGGAAQLVDTKDGLLSSLPLALGIIALVTFALLFLMFGSVLVPLKAIVLNLLSLTATFGAMVWVFQEGHLADLFGFTPTGTIEVTMPVLMFAVAFGLSMDYEVFLLSRIKEEYDRTGDNEHSVAVGLERTGRIVTAAALLLAVVLVAFGMSGVSFLKMFGFGMALAVLVDATLVRATLVPAFMKLAGRANWWAPRPLARLHERFGINEHPPAGIEPRLAPEVGAPR
ncbi:MAG: MMPL family transporter [Acidimicrobiia bacterium]|nr:MMPL family transporter [Acidimicrobiia bacterium]